MDRTPTTQLDPRFSDERARAVPWSEGREQLIAAPTYWLATVRSDGRPHVTTIAGIWLDESFCFTTGASEQKARNLDGNRSVVVTSGRSDFAGTDIVIEGEARRVDDAERLRRLAQAFIEKYGDMFRFAVRDGRLELEEEGGGEVLAFEVVVSKGFAFTKDDPFGQTRWRFEPVRLV
jgi:hypothetical protein